MRGNAESAHVRGQQCLGLQVFGRLGRLLRKHVDVGPAFVVLPHVQGHEIESAEALADLAQVQAVAAVAAEEEPTLWRLQCKGDPQRLVAREHAARVMSREQDMHAQARREVRP